MHQKKKAAHLGVGRRSTVAGLTALGDVPALLRAYGVGVTVVVLLTFTVVSVAASLSLLFS